MAHSPRGSYSSNRVEQATTGKSEEATSPNESCRLWGPSGRHARKGVVHGLPASVSGPSALDKQRPTPAKIGRTAQNGGSRTSDWMVPVQCVCVIRRSSQQNNQSNQSCAPTAGENKKQSSRLAASSKVPVECPPRPRPHQAGPLWGECEWPEVSTKKKTADARPGWSSVWARIASDALSSKAWLPRFGVSVAVDRK